MIEDSSEDSEFEVDVVEISDSNSDATRSPGSPSKRPSNHPRKRQRKTPPKGCMNGQHSAYSLGGGGFPYERDGDACQEIEELKETNLGVAQALFEP